ncbi:hypothetical protein ACQPZX_25135 [Actinoplanes sp. CA-142083]|uniref:hypothetical protein n=1 Tax=Actinoplanes sp. CA-142083 TaxID=3239903 RepID=UPI003D8AE84A
MAVIGRRLRRRLTTPELYRLVVVGLVVIGVAAGLAGIAAERRRSSLLADIGGVSGPLSVGAQDLYRSLSDADAAAANAFLAGGTEPAKPRQRYLDDIAVASAALSVALRGANAGDTALLRVVADRLPVYTGLVETARSYNRIGVPLGGAYLQEASALMRQTLLPAARELFESAQRRLMAAQRDAAGLPWVGLVLGLVTVGCLVGAQVMLRRRTNRMFNTGLLVATGIAVLALVWSAGAIGLAGQRVEQGQREGSAVVGELAPARRAALQARADEALALIARGGGAAFEADFGEQTKGLPDAGRWRAEHARVRELDDGGEHETAVALAAGSTAFAEVDAAIGRGLEAANARVSEQASDARAALTGLWVGLVLLTGGLVAAVVLGFRPRIGEYR